MKVITYQLKNDQKEFEYCQKTLLERGFKWRDSGNKIIPINPSFCGGNLIYITVNEGKLTHNNRLFKKIFPDAEETVIEFSSREEKLKRILK